MFLPDLLVFWVTVFCPFNFREFHHLHERWIWSHGWKFYSQRKVNTIKMEWKIRSCPYYIILYISTHWRKKDNILHNFLVSLTSKLKALFPFCSCNSRKWRLELKNFLPLMEESQTLKVLFILPLLPLDRLSLPT